MSMALMLLALVKGNLILIRLNILKMLQFKRSMTVKQNTHQSMEHQRLKKLSLTSLKETII
jgi:uncharacterized integral membrane protein